MFVWKISEDSFIFPFSLIFLYSFKTFANAEDCSEVRVGSNDIWMDKQKGNNYQICYVTCIYTLSPFAEIFELRFTSLESVYLTVTVEVSSVVINISKLLQASRQCRTQIRFISLIVSSNYTICGASSAPENVRFCAMYAYLRQVKLSIDSN